MTITLDGSNLSTVGLVNSKTAQNSTSGTAIDFTGIPSGVKRISVMFSGVSTNGTSYVILQSGSGSIESTGYLGACGQMANASTTAVFQFSSGIIIDGGTNAAAIRHGVIRMNLINSATNLWAFEGCIGRSDNTISSSVGGTKTFSGVIDRVRITTSNGTDTFDAGSINILYE